MAKDLEFKQEGLGYVCEFEPGGKCVVQIERVNEEKAFAVYGSIDGMKPVRIYSRESGKKGGILFQLDVAEGVRVKLVSWSEVTKAVVV